MKKAAVIGAGTMGRGIAYSLALNEFLVYVNDVSLEALDDAKEKIEQDLKTSANKGYITENDVEMSLKNLSFSTNLKESVEDADFVIEAALEKIDLKVDIFKQLDSYCKPDAILATNTSTMSPTEIGAHTSRPDKVVAMHFFNPVHKMKLIEVIRGLDTSDATVETVKEIASKLKKETAEVNEFPGFVTSRMNCLIGNEAMNLLMEGVASAEDIDKAMKLGLNHPMGPLELADLVGLDTRLRNMEYLHKTLGEKYRPCPLLIKYVKAGRLGKKSKSGFYSYE
ncbi:3-hydroxyacyl-CoA dehydrogenase family protein [Salipaludibacillus sp. CF4.18]|uniref:3-hydroxyacyl-CoA dehydrogenase family protein n=1 Tax=Salipaludibacillus sp. CF4.18 TaxID=3373081 RepID=UPI003EE633B4